MMRRKNKLREERDVTFLMRLVKEGRNKNKLVIADASLLCATFAVGK